MERVHAELELLGKKGAKRLHFADANFGALTRDVEIADFLVKTHDRYGAPALVNISYAKNATSRVAEIIRKLYEADMVDKAIISFQTLDMATLENVDRSNIKLQSYYDLLRIFKNQGIPTTTELILGLPGQTPKTFANDINYCFAHMIIPQVFLVRVLTNAPMAEPDYLSRFKIVTNAGDNIISSSSFSEADMKFMIRYNLSQIVLIHEAFLKYIFYYYQIEHKVRAVDVIFRLLEIADKPDTRYPLIARFMQNMINTKSDTLTEFMHPCWKKEQSKPVLDTLDQFYQEYFKLMENEYQAKASAAEKQSLKVLQLSLMQKPHRHLPDMRPVPHDVVSYFSQLTHYVSIDDVDDDFTPLHQFAPGIVTTPKQYVKNLPYNYARSPMRYLPEWPMYIDNLALQPYLKVDEVNPSYHKHMR